MLSPLLNFLTSLAEFSLLGCVEVASVAGIVYYIYAKTRAPAIIAGLFPNLKLNINYGSSTTRDTNKNVLAHGLNTQNMLEITPHSGRKPFNSSLDYGVYMPHVAQSLRSKKFEYNSLQVCEVVKKDTSLTHAIKTAAEQILREERKGECNHQTGSIPNTDIRKYQEILKSQERRASNILQDMASTLNNFLLALTSWILYKLLPMFLSGVVTHTQQIDMLKKVSEKSPGTPLIFLPLHRSHLDYIMVTFILTNNDIKSPLVAAGNNLQIPVFGGLLRGLGAFFIKRKIDPVVGKKDILYRAILQLYLQHALKMGHNVEFFIEGGRTRTGKPCMPKGGILSVIVNAFMDGTIPDALLVPVSVNYERLVDGNFVREQKGEKKEPESFGKAMSGIWKALNSKYGLMRIDFNEPYSIRELVQSFNKIALEEGSAKVYKPSARTLQHNISTSSLYGTDVVCEEHRTLIESISREVVFDCAVTTSVMTTNALAFLFLTRYRSGAEDKIIAQGLDELRNYLKGRKDMGFAGDSLHIINYATDLLGTGLVKRTQDERGQVFLRPQAGVEPLIELSYYSNMLTPHFALQSLLMTTFHALLPKTSTNDEYVGITRQKLIQTTLENCDVYRYEFILNKPTQVLENLLEVTLDELFLRGFIKLQQFSQETESNMESRKIARNIAAFLDEDEDEYGNDDDYINIEKPQEPDIFFAKETIEEQRSLCEVLAPFGHSYLAVAQSLNILYQNSMLETEFVKFVMKDLTNKVKNGTCPYAESISTDSVRNCLKLLEKWTVIEICNQHGLRLVSLGALYENSKDTLKSVVERIAGVVPNYKNNYF